MDKERIIQEFVPGKQVTLAHLIAHPPDASVPAFDVAVRNWRRKSAFRMRAQLAL